MSAKLWLIAILIMAAGLRLYGLADARHGYGSDEVLYAYDGWSIARTGTDHRQTGHPPLYLKGFSDVWDNRTSVLLPYIMAGEVALFGYPTTVMMRWPSALVGIGTVWLVYLVARQLRLRPAASLVAAGMMAINPTSILMSRQGHDPIFLAFFALLLVWSMLKTRDQPRFWWLVGTALALGAYGYQPFKFVGPILAALTAWFIWPSLRKQWRWVIGGLGLGSVLVLPLAVTQLLHWSEVQGEFSRLNIFHYSESLRLLVANTKLFFTWGYLFNPQTVWPLVPILALGGVVSWWRQYRAIALFVFGWFVIGLIPGLIMITNYHEAIAPVPRILGSLGALEIMAATGLFSLVTLMRARFGRLGAMGSVFAIVVASGTMMAVAYIRPHWRIEAEFRGFDHAIQTITADQTSRPVFVYMEDPNIPVYFLWATHYDPRDFQRQPVTWQAIPTFEGPLQAPIVFGRFHFCTRCQPTDQALMIAPISQVDPTSHLLERLTVAGPHEHDWALVEVTQGSSSSL